MKSTAALLSVFLIGSGCSDTAKSQTPSKAEPPAKLSGTAVKEADLPTITLTTDAENRLGIRVEEAKTGSGAAANRYTGEVVEPTGSRLAVSTSVAGTLQPVAGADCQVCAACRGAIVTVSEFRLSSRVANALTRRLSP